MVSAATELPRSSPLELWKTRVVSGRGPCQLAEMPRMRDMLLPQNAGWKRSLYVHGR